MRSFFSCLGLMVGVCWLISVPAWSQTLPDPGSLINEVISGHPSVRRAQHLVEAAEANLSGSRLQPNPILTLSATAGDAGEDSNSLTQSFEISGQPRLRHEQAQARLESARLALRSARRSVAAAVYTDWLELWESQHLAQMSRLRLSLMTEMSRVTRRRFEVGEIPENESLRVELAAAEAEADAQRAVARYLAAQRSLGLMRGQSVFEEIPAPVEVGDLPPAPEDFQGLFEGPGRDSGEPPWTLEQVLASAETHPDVEALRQDQRALLLAADLLAKERAPQLGVSLYRSRFFGSEIEQGAQLSVSWPLFDWGGNSARQKAQRSEAAAQLAESDMRVLALRRQVAEGWTTWQAARSVRDILKIQAQRYQELAREARIGYDLGLLTLSDVLQTEAAFRQAGVQLIQAQAEVHRLELGLLQSTNLSWPIELLEER